MISGFPRTLDGVETPAHRLLDGNRRNGIQEADGSIPFSSTKLPGFSAARGGANVAPERLRNDIPSFLFPRPHVEHSLHHTPLPPRLHGYRGQDDLELGALARRPLTSRSHNDCAPPFRRRSSSSAPRVSHRRDTRVPTCTMSTPARRSTADVPTTRSSLARDRHLQRAVVVPRVHAVGYVDAERAAGANHAVVIHMVGRQ